LFRALYNILSIEPVLLKISAHGALGHAKPSAADLDGVELSVLDQPVHVFS